MGAKYTDAQKRAAEKYNKEHTSLISIRVQKEKKRNYIKKRLMNSPKA